MAIVIADYKVYNEDDLEHPIGFVTNYSYTENYDNFPEASLSLYLTDRNMINIGTPLSPDRPMKLSNQKPKNKKQGKPKNKKQRKPKKTIKENIKSALSQIEIIEEN
jgi:hypothetical protein